jgi:hypothetical protein
VPCLSRSQILYANVLAQPRFSFEADVPVTASRHEGARIGAEDAAFFSQEFFDDMDSNLQPMSGWSGLRDAGWSDLREAELRGGREDVPLARLTSTGVGAGRSWAKDTASTAIALRAAQHTLSMNESAVGYIRPDVALKASNGDLLGHSQAASGYILALGFGGNALVSADADLGGAFYKHGRGQTKIGMAVSGTFPIAVASEDLACFSFPGQVDCVVVDHVARKGHRAYYESLANARPTAQVWSKTTTLQTKGTENSCPWRFGDKQKCVGEAAAAWGVAVAAVVNSSTGLRFVKTSYAVKTGTSTDADGGTRDVYSFVCTSGCNSNPSSPNSNMSSYDPTYGKVLAMHGNVIAVGTPGKDVDSDGRVEVYFAKGAADSSGYGQHKGWELVSTLPPPPPPGTNIIEYTGKGGFASALSLSSKWLAIGAPGSSTITSIVRIYKVSESSISHFCEVTHPKAAAASRFGVSISQSSHMGSTVMIIGAPGEGKVYSVVLREDPAMCEIRDMLLPEKSDHSPEDGFGFSAVISQQFVFVGAPFFERWYKDASGLLYVSAFCFPGSIRPASSGRGNLVTCSMCNKDQTSSGGASSTCTACSIKIPGNASLDYGCAYTCNMGYFGTSCIPCPQYATSVGWSKTQNAEWVVGEKLCRPRCIGGYYNESGTCKECPTVDEFQSRQNVEWKPETCTVQCVMGYFPYSDASEPAEQCYRCSEYMAKRDKSPPANAEYVNGLATCKEGEWAAKVGYNCTFDAQLKPNCQPCMTKPAAASYVDSANRLSKSKCDFKCDPFYFGHGQGYANVCVECGKLQVEHAKNPLPNNALWQPKPLTCSDDSWNCKSGYSRADPTITAAKFCCPDILENSYPDRSYQPCGRACNTSFFFNNKTATCDKCETADTTDKKQNHIWKLDCDFECKCTKGDCFYGRKELNNCFKCKEYHERLGTTKPHRASWYIEPIEEDGSGTFCNELAWGCPGGYLKSVTAVPPGCCPISLPYSSVTKIGGAEYEDTCGYKCIDNYKWDPDLKNCTFVNIARIPNSKWNYRNGRWECLPGFKALPQGYLQPHTCMECSIHAVEQKWVLPANGYWLNSSEISGSCKRCQGQCNVFAFSCVGSYAKNAEARLCCSSEKLPETVLQGTHENGVWDSSKCEYRCNKTQDSQLFPLVPSKSDPICKTCDRYLADYGVIEIPADDAECRACPTYDCEACQRHICKSTEPQWCSNLEFNMNSGSCTASIQLKFQIQGIAAQNFTAQGVDRIMMNALADLIQVDRSNVVPSYVEKNDGPLNVRRASKDVLMVGVLLRYLDPVSTRRNFNTLKSKSAVEVGNALNRAGYDVFVALKDQVFGPSTEALKCKEGYTLNSATGRCCYTTAPFQAPVNIPTSRYAWEDNGCKYKCLDTFSGLSCQTCSEMNQDQAKPDNSVWDNDRPSCPSDGWKCRTGYVRVGSICASLKQLQEKCAAKTRCATCKAESSCVWCGSKCVPGEKYRPDVFDISSAGSGKEKDGCPYINDELSPVCQCEKSTCSQECGQHTSCSECVQDSYCGWCAGSEKCLFAEQSLVFLCAVMSTRSPLVNLVCGRVRQPGSSHLFL